LVLLPLTSGLALAGVLLLSRGAWRSRTEPTFPLLMLTVAHGALVLLWPTTKFRYLVPLFPLAVLFAAGLLSQIQPVAIRSLLIGISLTLALFTSTWTWASIPSHTYYYDGGIVGDNFGAQGEIAYVDEIRHLEAAAEGIRRHGPGVVLGPHPMYALTRQPLVVDSGAFSAEIVRHLVERYSVRYLVADPSRLTFYSSLIPGQMLWQDERFGVYALN
jgi:hypothetical protein